MTKKTKWITSDPNFVPKPALNRPTPEELADMDAEYGIERGLENEDDSNAEYATNV